MFKFTEVMKNLKWENFGIEDLLSISATLRSISREFTTQDLPIPPELVEQHGKALRMIADLRREYLETELRRIQASYSVRKKDRTLLKVPLDTESV